MYKIVDFDLSTHGIKFYGVSDIDDEPSASNVDYKLLGTLKIEDFKMNGKSALQNLHKNLCKYLIFNKNNLKLLIEKLS